MTIIVRDAADHDQADWRRLWAGYLAFYRVELAEETTAGVWRRVLDPTEPLFCRVAAMNGGVIGFAVCVIHAGTWSSAPACYLEDLFVDPAARGGGAGAALIQDLIDRGRRDGWRRLYWHTHADNRTARRLYDRFAVADGFVRYDIDLRPPSRL